MHSLRADLWVEHDLRSPVPTRGHVLGQEACVVVLRVGYPRQAEVTDLRVAPKVRGHEPEVFLFKSFSTKPHKPPLRSDNLCSSQSSEATRNRGGGRSAFYIDHSFTLICHFFSLNITNPWCFKSLEPLMLSCVVSCTSPPLTVSVPLCGGCVYSDITGGAVPTKS